MTVATSRPSVRVEVNKGDVRTTYQDRTWQQFKYLQKSLENVGVRLSYYDGTVGVLMPGRGWSGAIISAPCQQKARKRGLLGSSLPNSLPCQKL
ncbi:MAG: hypothetical protein AAF635_14495, partial [Cyanobacteria bacterium P01_C01_bin.69]